MSANARLTGGVTIQGGTSTGRGVQDRCETVVKIDSPDPRGCAVTEPWITAVRGLASYTVPKVDVLVSGTFRSLRTTIPFLQANNSATNGASLNANYNVPNTVVQTLLGRLPSGSNANGTTIVNLVEPAQVYGERVTQIDMRFAKIFRFGGRRSRCRNGPLQPVQHQRSGRLRAGVRLRHAGCELVAADVDRSAAIRALQRDADFLARLLAAILKGGRMRSTLRCVVVAVAVAASSSGPELVGQSQPAAVQAQVDKIFSRWTTATPGCAVGAAVKGQTVARSAYGMADLERDIPNTPRTVFDAGSVAKQFTAAAMLLLERDGKLSLDDPVHKHIPELPGYGVPVTIRQMLQHTSGLRDWAALATIAGVVHGTFRQGHVHILDILRRQRELNFPPGSRWLYSNSGYALAAIIVSRVSGMSFADFTASRIFQPLGMNDTSWQQDLGRIVKHRALGYSERERVFALDMSLAVADGSGGLLTTVDDLLKWNENFVRPIVGDTIFLRELQRRATFADGRTARVRHGTAGRYLSRGAGGGSQRRVCWLSGVCLALSRPAGLDCRLVQHGGGKPDGVREGTGAAPARRRAASIGGRAWGGLSCVDRCRGRTVRWSVPTVPPA